MQKHLIQGSLEWKEYRKSRIGASDAPPIMGTSPWKTSYQLWREKIGSENSNQMTYSMQRGLALEDAARQELEKITGDLYLPIVKEHPELPWMIASLDGVDQSNTYAIEIKCPSTADHNIALAGNIPDKYFPQLQHQLEVCQMDKALYFSFDGSHGVIVTVYRDDKYIKEMLKKEKEFWNFMQELTPPPMTERDFHERCDEVWNRKASLWIEINAQIRELENKEEALREELIHLAEDKNTIGAGLQISKCFRKGSIDYGKIPELIGVNLDDYRKKPNEYWKLMAKDN